MKNLTVENVYTRQTAKQLVKKHFWKLLGMMLIMLIITYAMSFGGTLLTVMPGESASASAITIVIGIVVLLAVMLVGSGLSLGMIAAMIYICRNGEQPKVSQVSSRMGICLKGIGLNLWVGLKTLLWALPVYIPVMALGIYLISDPNAIQSSEAAVILMSFLPFVAVIAALVLVVPAALRYMLSTYVLADDPGTRVFDCVRQSKAMMKGHKWQAFKLAVPPILVLYGWMLAISIPFGIVMALVDSATALLVVSILVYIALIVLALIISLRIALGYCLFYLKRTGEMPAIPPEEAERIVCWQPGKAPQPAGEPVASANDEHIAGWQPTEEKPDKD